MIRNLFEESTASISAKVKRGKLKKKKIKFTFTQEGGATTLEPVEVDAKGDETVIEITLPKVKDDEDSFTLSCSVEADGETYKHPIEYVVWPKSVEVTCKGTDGKATPKASLTATQKDGVIKTLVVADKDGKLVHNCLNAGPLTFAPNSPYQLEGWTKEKGRKREATVTRKPYKATILSPTKPSGGSKTADKDGKLMWFVNLEAGANSPKNAGSTLEVEIGPDGNDPSVTRAGDPIFVKCTFSKTGKRTSPKQQLLAEGVEGWAESDEGKTFKGQVKVAADGGRAKLKLELGNGGGEAWTVEVGQTDACTDDKLELVTWRRVYVQVQRAKELAAFDVEKFMSCMKEVFILPARLTENELDASKAPGKSVGAWLDGGDCGKTAGKSHLLAGNTGTNATAYQKLLDTKAAILEADRMTDDEKAPDKLSASVIYCDEQVDFGAEAFSAVDVHKDADVTLTKSGTKEVTKVAIKTKPWKATFYAKSSKGALPVTAASWQVDTVTGNFDLAKVTVTYSEADGPLVSIDTSADAAFKSATKAHADGKKFILRFGYEKASVFNGEAFGDRGRHLLVSGRFGGRAAAEVCGTMAHELGHALNMSLADDYDAVTLTDARKDHGFHYQRSGDHCAFGMTAPDYKGAAKKAGFDWDVYDGKDLSDSCKCVMYGYGGSKRSNSYCEKCSPYLLAHDVKEFKKAR